MAPCRCAALGSRIDSVEQCTTRPIRSCRRGREHRLGATPIDAVEIVLVAPPEMRDAGEVIERSTPSSARSQAAPRRRPSRARYSTPRVARSPARRRRAPAPVAARSSSAATRWRPTKPQPPVTRTRAIQVDGPGVVRGARRRGPDADRDHEGREHDQRHDQHEEDGDAEQHAHAEEAAMLRHRERREGGDGVELRDQHGERRRGVEHMHALLVRAGAVAAPPRACARRCGCWTPRRGRSAAG